MRCSEQTINIDPQHSSNNRLKWSVNRCTFFFYTSTELSFVHPPKKKKKKQKFVCFHSNKNALNAGHCRLVGWPIYHSRVILLFNLLDLDDGINSRKPVSGLKACRISWEIWNYRKTNRRESKICPPGGRRWCERAHQAKLDSSVETKRERNSVDIDEFT